jgi:hypothetical protein
MSGAFVSYVKPDKDSGILIYRHRFPTELTRYIPRADGLGMGRKELRVSLMAKSLDDPGAAERWQSAKAEYGLLVAQAKKNEAAHLKRTKGAFDVLAAPDIAFLSEALYQEELEIDDKARWDAEERELFKNVAAQLSTVGVAASSPWTGKEGSRWASKARETVEASLAASQSMRANGDLEAIVEWWRDEALELAEARGIVMDPSDAEGLVALCRALNDASIAAGKDRLKRLGGEDYPATPPEPLRPEHPRPRTTLSLLELFDGYASAQELAATTRKEWRHNITAFTRFFGT